jgi:hypothetical protein
MLKNGTYLTTAEEDKKKNRNPRRQIYLHKALPSLFPRPVPSHL